MAQNFWTAIWAWTVCFVVTIIVSFLTRPRPDAELRGLVYSLTERPPSDAGEPWYRRVGTLAVVVLGVTLVLNLIFF